MNLRSDGQRAFHRDSEHVHIVSKTDKDGIDIHIDPGTKGETVHIPVVITKSGVKDLVYNDFFIGEGAEVKIVAGCGIHNCGGCDSEHDGIHTFHVGKNAKVTYVEKHYGEGDGAGKTDSQSPDHSLSGGGRVGDPGHQPDQGRGRHQALHPGPWWGRTRKSSSRRSC